MIGQLIDEDVRQLLCRQRAEHRSNPGSLRAQSGAAQHAQSRISAGFAQELGITPALDGRRVQHGGHARLRDSLQRVEHNAVMRAARRPVAVALQRRHQMLVE